MTRIVTIILAMAMVAHLIKPFGFPGLKKRGDVWKIAVLAFGIVVVVAGLKSTAG